MESCIPKLPNYNDGTYTHGVMSRSTKNYLALWHLKCCHDCIRTGISEGDMADDMQKDWRELCIAVTNETDSTRLPSLVQELIEALDRGRTSRRNPIPQTEAIVANCDAA